jgi:hypothetical protein
MTVTIGLSRVSQSVFHFFRLNRMNQYTSAVRNSSVNHQECEPSYYEDTERKAKRTKKLQMRTIMLIPTTQQAER